MINRMFAVQDIKAGAFHAPFPSVSEGTALRFLQDMVNREGHPYNLHPEDYIVFEIGSFDDVSGALAPETLRSIVHLTALT